MGRPGRPAELRDGRVVSVYMERETLRRIEEMGVERSAFIRGAVEMMLGSDVLKELRAEVRRLKRLLQERERRINALKREIAEKERVIAELRERLEGALEGKGKRAKKEGRREEK